MEEPGAAHARLRTEAGRRGRSLEPAHEHRQQQLRHGTALHRREWEGEGLLVNCELSCIRSCFRGTATPGPQTSHLVSTVELGANLLIHEEGLSTGYIPSVHGSCLQVQTRASGPCAGSDAHHCIHSGVAHCAVERPDRRTEARAALRGMHLVCEAYGMSDLRPLSCTVYRVLTTVCSGALSGESEQGKAYQC